ncbi:MAG: T9SS type A sorting domain-containing protein [Bacteroidetes bacterium]|nr:T9SS type A sorting domain-containing protein [Bacteroidota bacterium]
MNKIYLLILLAIGFMGLNTSQAQVNIIPSSDEILFPKYMSNGTVVSKRVPYACMLKLTGLNASTTYRYYTGATTNSNLTTGSAPGNFYSINNVSGSFGKITGYTSQKSLGGNYLNNDSFITTSGSNRYSEFTTDANGEYKGYFSLVTTGNNVFKADSNVYFYVLLNDGAGGTTVTNRYRTTNTIKMLALGTSNASGSTNCSAIRGNSLAAGETFIFLYDNTTSTGRPLYGTWAENDGITTTFTSWYNPTVDTTTGAWGAVIPNDNSNGVRRIESRDWSGNVLFSHTSANGTWPNGTNTTNPTNDTIPLVIALNDAPLGNTGPQKQKVQFTATTAGVSEAAGTTTVSVSISAATAANENVTVYIKGGSATNSSDYSLQSSAINFSTGTSANQSITINITDDQLTEGAESIILALRDPSNGLAIGTDSTITITINDNDVPTVSFSSDTSSAKESVDTVWFTVNITNPDPNNATSVDVALTGGSATSGDDYVAYSTKTLTFPAGSSAPQKVWIKLINDTIVEFTEDIILTLQNATNQPQITNGTHTLTIYSNDSLKNGTLLSIYFDGTSDTVTEGSTATVKVTILMADPNNDIKVDIAANGGTAISGTHYNYTTQTLTFVKGTTTLTQSVSVNTLSDNKNSGNHTLNLKLQNSSSNILIGSPDTYSITIKEDGKNGVSQAFKALGVELYPNPTQNILNINSQDKIDRLIITNINGQLVYNNKPNTSTLKLSTQDFAPGVYIVQIEINGQLATQKIVKY